MIGRLWVVHLPLWSNIDLGPKAGFETRAQRGITGWHKTASRIPQGYLLGRVEKIQLVTV